MKYIAVKNFEKHQHYRDRVPPWIKLYNTALDDYAFLQLSDASRSHLMLLWLLASRHANKIPYDLKYISGAIHARGKVDMPALLASGFLMVVEHDASAPLASDASGAIKTGDAERETERERETEKKQTPPTRSISVTETLLVNQCGEHYPPIARFLSERPLDKRDAWAGDLLQLIGPVTGNLPEDLARACTDGHLAEPPVTNAKTLRIFVASCRQERTRGNRTDATPRTAQQADGEAGQAFAAIRAMITNIPNPGRAPIRAIPKAQVMELGDRALAAYEQIGGADRFLDQTEKVGFVIRDFTKAYNGYQPQRASA